MRRGLVVAAALVGLAFQAPPDRGPVVRAPTAATEPAPAPALLQRVVVLGASVSGGFMLQNEVGAPTALADVVEATLAGAHKPIREHTSLGLFLGPLARGGKLVDRTLEEEPTLVLAVDFLFWFGYGYHGDGDARLAKLQEGLWLLERLDVPLVVGDFPDMSPALEGKGPFGVPMLQAGQIPRPETLERLNSRLAAWAAEREGVVVVPLAEFVRRLHSGEPVELRGNRWESSKELLQPDRLHTSLEGTAALVVLAFDRLCVARSDLPPAALRWDARAIARSTYDAQAAERERLAEKQRARDARRAAREARRAARDEDDAREPR